ncbi:hypothetical protein [Streptomyces sp. NPDC093225]|uniref:hypothetical protein n=1 Tax=Streptomyces sp. NPDC093225 TaxID=3366034 RepID=UPI003804F67F
MYEQYGHYSPQSEPAAFWPEADREQHAAYGGPLGPGGVDAPWDLSEELAHLCSTGNVAAPGRAESIGQVTFGQTCDETVTGVGVGLASGPADGGLPPGIGQRHPAPVPGGHRRGSTARTPVVAVLRTSSLCTAVLVAVIATVVSMFSGLAVCEALRHSAGPRTAHDVASWWPLLIYGPWMVASLSILRAALHQHRALHSWSIVLLFSTLATLLCVAQAPRTFAAQAAATLPPIAALACFQQLVRQITLTRPPRQLAPRHRSGRSAQLRPPTAAGGRPGPSLPDYGGRDQRDPDRTGTGYRYRFRYGS